MSNSSKVDSDDLERERFEYWASDKGKYPRAIERSGNIYRLITTNTQWEAWQAALSSKQEN